MKQSSVGGLIVSLALVVLGVGTLWWLFPAFLTGLWSGFRASWIVIIPAVILLIIAIVISAAGSSGWSFFVGLFAFGWLVFGGISVHYWQLQSIYEASVTRSDVAPADLSFRERAPYDVAKATSERTLGETTGDATGKIRSIPAAGETGEYTTSVVRRGMFQGYESTQTLTPPLYGTSVAKDVTFCEFDSRAKLRFGGIWPVNNLKTAIYHRVPLGTLANQDDAFAVCEDGVPYIYAPLTRQEGFAITKRVPSGVAIYNGQTGDLRIEHQYEGELPVYPQSIATDQRASTVASGSLSDYWFKRVGWEDTGKDKSDPNGANRAEFGLADSSGDTQFYVTPLNPRGSSSSIVALGIADASKMEAGKFNDYTIHSYPKGESRQANSAVADSITGGVLQGYQASGLKVFEVVPAEDGAWSATVGKKQSILYRATIAADGTITLRDANGDQVGGAVTVGKGGDVEREQAEAPASAPSSITTLSDDELRTLGNQIINELSKRAAQK